MSTDQSQKVAPAEGHLGILIPGLGAVASTFIAGVELIKRGLGQPIGSLTQLGTVRLGKQPTTKPLKLRSLFRSQHWRFGVRRVGHLRGRQRV